MDLKWRAVQGLGCWVEVLRDHGPRVQALSAMCVGRRALGLEFGRGDLGDILFFEQPLHKYMQAYLCVV